MILFYDAVLIGYSDLQMVNSTNNNRLGLYLPNTSGRMWHKVNFLTENCWFEFRVFLLLD